MFALNSASLTFLIGKEEWNGSKILQRGRVSYSS